MTKPTLDDLRRSAEFCGYRTFRKGPQAEVWIVIDDSEPYPYDVNARWNPPDNPAQDRELLRAITDAGYRVSFVKEGHPNGHTFIAEYQGPPYQWTAIIWLDCHPNDFLTLAASKLKEIKDG